MTSSLPSNFNLLRDNGTTVHINSIVQPLFVTTMGQFIWMKFSEIPNPIIPSQMKDEQGPYLGLYIGIASSPPTDPLQYRWYQWKGDTATISVGEVYTVAPEEPANVVNVGTNTNAVLNFSLPQGITGPTGPKGDQGEIGPTGPTGAKGSYFFPQFSIDENMNLIESFEDDYPINSNFSLDDNGHLIWRIIQ